MVAKRQYNILSGILLLIPLLVACDTSFAAPATINTSIQDSLDLKDNAFGLGLTVSVVQRPFIGINDQVSLLPYFSYRHEWFYVEGLDLGVNVYKTKRWKVDLLATPRFYEVKESFAKNNELAGIEQTHPTYFGGLTTQVKTPTANVTLQVLHDLIESDGNEVVIQAGKSFQPAKSLTLIPSLGLTYQDARLVDYFYGVQANEVQAGRPLYQGRAAVNYNITLNAIWKTKGHLDLLGQLKYELLGDGISDSPIVDETAVYSVTVGAVYRF